MIQAGLEAAGGLALFLLAMSMMTDGLKIAGGEGLTRLLRNWTSTPARGVLSGILVVLLVQASSAVTIATIGFVNAGVLTLRQALGVVFGAHVGTTATGWLVSLVGFGFRIEAFALPVLALGMLVKMAAPGQRAKAAGEALAGFGMFFLGLAILSGAFSGIAQDMGTEHLAALDGFLGVLAFVGLGIVITVLAQSSSASVALVITAAAEGMIGFEAAAAAVIGANIGTTSTALLAVIGATAAAKRVAMGHLLFSVVAAIVALATLPLLLAGIEALADLTGLGTEPAPMLALFHTVFNLLGVALLLPIIGFVARQLERLFHSAEEDLGRPQHLDGTLVGTPDLALAALGQELVRMSGIVAETGRVAATGPHGRAAFRIDRRTEAIGHLGAAIGEFAVGLHMQDLSRDTAERLPRLLRVSRYLAEAARLAPEAERLRAELPGLRHNPAGTAVELVLRAVADVLDPALSSAEVEAAQRRFEQLYQAAKDSLLAAAAAGGLGVHQVGTLLDLLSRTRRMVQQFAKGLVLLRREAVEDARTDPAETEDDPAGDADGDPGDEPGDAPADAPIPPARPAEAAPPG